MKDQRPSKRQPRLSYNALKLTALIDLHDFQVALIYGLSHRQRAAYYLALKPENHAMYDS